MADNPLRADDGDRKKRRRALRAAWYLKHKGRIRAERKAAYAADSKGTREATRKWYAENRDKALAYHRTYREINKDKLRAYHKAHHAANPERVRDNGLRKLYGLTSAQWDELFQSQGRMCAICKVERPGCKQWQTDHCHRTGKVRGILCAKCNRTAGNHDATYLRSVADYVERHSVSMEETCAVRIPTAPAIGTSRGISSQRKPKSSPSQKNGPSNRASGRAK